MTIRGVYLNPGTGYGVGQWQTALYINDGLSIPDSPVGTWSYWYRFTDWNNNSSYIDILNGFTTTAPDGYAVTIPQYPYTFYSFMNIANGYLNSGAGGPLTLSFKDDWTTPTAQWFPYTGPVELDDGHWHHILVSWDCNHAALSRIFKATIDGYTVLTSVQTPHAGFGDFGSAFTVPYSSAAGWTISDVGSWRESGDLAELWFFPGVALDVTNPTVIAKFLNLDGTPANLGSNGQTPTGTAPPLYLSCRSSTADDFLTNLGTGGGTFSLHPNTQFPLVLSTDDPHVDLPIRVVTQDGTTTDVTLHSTNYAGSDLAGNLNWFSTIVQNRYASFPVINDSTGAPVINLGDPTFDAGTGLPSSASFIRIEDDGITADSMTIDPPVIGDTNSWFAASDTDNVYVAGSDETSFVSMAVMPITDTTTPVGTNFTLSSWMTNELSQSYPTLTANIVRWDGKTQFVGFMDTAPNGGNAAMIDADGTPTDAKIWGGYKTDFERYWISNRGAMIPVTIPDATSGNNYILTTPIIAGYDGMAAMIAIADNTGTDVSRFALHGDTANAEAIINGFTTPDSTVYGVGVVTNNAGFHFLAHPYSRSDPFLLYTLNKDCTSYTVTRFLLDPDDNPTNMLMQGWWWITGLADGVRKWLYGTTGVFFTSSSFTEDEAIQTSNPTQFTKLSGVDIVCGDSFGSQITLQSSGDALYQLSPAPLDPDYFYACGINPLNTGATLQPVPDDYSLYVIMRADGSNNGYKAGITITGGDWILSLQVMPSGTPTTLNLGPSGDGTSAFASIELYVVTHGSTIEVGASAFIDSSPMFLAPDGTFSIPSSSGYANDYPANTRTFPAAISISDSTYTDPGNILIGGSRP